MIEVTHTNESYYSYERVVSIFFLLCQVFVSTLTPEQKAGETQRDRGRQLCLPLASQPISVAVFAADLSAVAPVYIGHDSFILGT